MAIEGAGDQGGGRGKRGGEQGRTAIGHGADHQDHPSRVRVVVIVCSLHELPRLGNWR